MQAQTPQEIKILLLDDNPEHAELVENSLQDNESSYLVDACGTPNDFFSHFESAHYDVLLIDFFLQGTDGFEVLRQLKKRKNKTPVVFFSGTEKDEIISQVLKEGADDFVLKSRTSLKTLPLVLRRSMLKKSALDVPKVLPTVTKSKKDNVPYQAATEISHNLESCAREISDLTLRLSHYLHFGDGAQTIIEEYERTKLHLHQLQRLLEQAKNYLPSS